MSCFVFTTIVAEQTFSKHSATTNAKEINSDKKITRTFSILNRHDILRNYKSVSILVFCLIFSTLVLEIQGFCGDSIKWSHNFNIDDVYGMWYGVGYAQHTPDMTNKPNQVGCLTLYIADATTENHDDWLDWSIMKKNYSDQSWRSDKSLPWSDTSMAGSWLNVRIKRNTQKELHNERDNKNSDNHNNMNRTALRNYVKETTNTDLNQERVKENMSNDKKIKADMKNEKVKSNLEYKNHKKVIINEMAINKNKIIIPLDLNHEQTNKNEADKNGNNEMAYKKIKNEDHIDFNNAKAININEINKKDKNKRGKRDIYNERRIRVIWDEDGQSLEQTYLYTPEEPGLWVADKRPMLEREMRARGIEIWYPDDPPRHPQVIRILKVTPHSLTINHCSELGGGGVFSLILKRSPSKIHYWEWYNIKRQLFNFDLPNIHRYTTICSGCVERSSFIIMLICLAIVLKMYV